MQKVLSGSIGQLEGKSITFNDDLPTLSELFCDETLPPSPSSPIHLPDPLEWYNGVTSSHSGLKDMLESGGLHFLISCVGIMLILRRFRQ